MYDTIYSREDLQWAWDSCSNDIEKLRIEEIDKREFIYELYLLERDGMRLTRKYTTEDTAQEIYLQYIFQTNLKDIRHRQMYMKQMLDTLQTSLEIEAVGFGGFLTFHIVRFIVENLTNESEFPPMMRRDYQHLYQLANVLNKKYQQILSNQTNSVSNDIPSYCN